MTNMETGASPLTSIQRATEHFILGLQADFSSTVSTVCKTGEKLAGNQLKGTRLSSLLLLGYVYLHGLPCPQY